TRLANLGIRGTEFSVRLDDIPHVAVDAGSVAITNAGGTMLVNAAGSAIVTSANAMPRPGGGKIDLHGSDRGGGPGSRPAPPGTQNFSGGMPPQQSGQSLPSNPQLEQSSTPEQSVPTTQPDPGSGLTTNPSQPPPQGGVADQTLPPPPQGESASPPPSAP
ncbi:MAG: hypothetical protein HQL49_12970, partial [Gammaproteobacteria bacterium]|nr:hypothetical protein [Gammaproteobacteria bacterium]